MERPSDDPRLRSGVLIEEHDRVVSSYWVLTRFIGVLALLLAFTAFAVWAFDPAPPARASAGARTTVVQQGDSLWSIASRDLGDGRRWPEIVEVNLLEVADVIQPGTVLKLPER